LVSRQKKCVKKYFLPNGADIEIVDLFFGRPFLLFEFEIANYFFYPSTTILLTTLSDFPENKKKVLPRVTSFFMKKKKYLDLFKDKPKDFLYKTFYVKVEFNLYLFVTL
jgi:hypothetical protein